MAWLTIIEVVLFGIILILYIIRIAKLDKMASNHVLKRTSTLVPKMLLILLLVALLILNIVLSFVLSNYYIHDFSLVGVFTIATLILQMYIIRTEWVKNAQRSYTMIVQWVLMSLFDMATIVAVEILERTDSILVLVFKAIIEIVLVVIAVWLDDPNPEGLPRESPNLIHLISNSSV